MCINNFPKLKQRHIKLWRIAVFAYVVLWALPIRLIGWVVSMPLELIFNIVEALFDALKDTLCQWVEIVAHIWWLLVRAAQICAYLPHATANEGQVSENGDCGK